MKRTVIKVLSAILVMTALLTGSVFAAPGAGSIGAPVIPPSGIILPGGTPEKAVVQQVSQGIPGNSTGKTPELDSWSSSDGVVFWDSITPGGSSMLDIFLNASGIAGESQDDRHKNQIDLLSFFFGADKAVKPADPANKNGLKMLRVYKKIDKSSPAFLQAMLGGNKINTLTIEVRKAGDRQQTAYMLVFNNAAVASLKQGVGGQGNIEEVCFSYSSGEYTYFKYGPSGTLQESISTLIPAQD